MGDSPNIRYSTRSAGTPASSTSIKQEPFEEDVARGHTKEPNAAHFLEASSSNCSSRDPLADEMEFGEGGLSFQNAFFDVEGNEIKTENLIAEEIEDSVDIVGSTSKRRKTCDEDSGEDSSTARTPRQSAIARNPTSSNSEMWLHFKKMEKAGKCLYCSKVICISRNSTFTLKRHLISKHKAVLLRKPESTDFGTNGEHPMGEESPTTVPGGIRELYLGRTMRPLSAETKEILDDYLLHLICKECFPFSTVDSEAFKQFCAALNPNYVLPSRNTITEALLERKYATSLQRIKETLSKTTKVALTFDEWTNMDNVRFYALTAHYINQNFRICSSLLKCSPLYGTSADFEKAQWIKRVIDEFNVQIHNVSVVVTDDQRDVVSAVRSLNLQHHPCFARVLNSVVVDSITDTIYDTIEKVQQIAIYFKENGAACSKLAEAQTEFNLPRVTLKHDIPSRWTSTYDMLERFCQNKVPLSACLESVRMENSLQSKDWTVVEQTMKVLKNFECAAKIASSEKNLMLSQVGLFINSLIKKTSDLLSADLEASVQNLAHSLIAGLSTMLKPTTFCAVVNQCMLLDPRMKRHSFDNEHEKYTQTYDAIVEQCVDFLAEAGVVANEKIPIADPYRQHLFSDFVKKVDVVERETTSPELKAKKELDEYISAPYITLTADPLLWWTQNRARFPTLWKIVRHLFIIPATSVPCERLFSKAGQIYNEKRARLNPKYVPKMLFLQHNGF